MKSFEIADFYPWWFFLTCRSPHAVACPSVAAATVGPLQAVVPPPAAKDRRAEFPDVPPLPVHDPHDTTPLSPLSQSSSGYFSASVSTVTLSDVLQPSSSSSSLLGADAASPSNPQQQQQQQGADGNDVVTSPPQCGAKMAVVASNHNNSVPAELSFSNQKLVEGFERLEIFVDDGDGRGHDDVPPDWLAEGAYVTVGSNKAGTVRYVGTTQFADGVWVGVELDTPVGKCEI